MRVALLHQAGEEELLLFHLLFSERLLFQELFAVVSLVTFSLEQGIIYGFF